MNYREILEDFVNNEDTDYCYDWQGFNYRTILPCIEQLLKNENNLQSKIDKANEILNKLCIYGYGQVNCRPIKNTTKQEVYNAMYEIKNVLKEAENVENN